VIAVPVLAVAWWLGSPLFIDRTVVEEFPRAATADVPEGQTMAEVEEIMRDAEGEAVAVGEDMPDAAPIGLLSGEFEGADDFHEGSGLATVYELDDGSRVLRLEALDVTNGPDLHVILSPATNPTTRDEVATPGYVDLGGLKGNKGDQNYDIPAEVDLTGEWTVVIYCQPFHVIFATAGLSPA